MEELKRALVGLIDDAKYDIESEAPPIPSDWEEVGNWTITDEEGDEWQVVAYCADNSADLTELDVPDELTVDSLYDLGGTDDDIVVVILPEYDLALEFTLQPGDVEAY